MRLRIFTFVCCFFSFAAVADILPPRPATQTEVTAGTDSIHPVTPKTLAGAGIGVTFPPSGNLNFGGQGATNLGFLTVTGAVNVNVLNLNQFQWTTNIFAGTVANLATNDYTIRTGTDVGFTDVSNVPTGAGGYTVVHIIATADINVTNHTKLNASDFLTTRVLTNGTQADFLFQAQSGSYTNSYFVRSPHN